MAVQDPTYDRFDYQSLLDRAVSPVDRLGQGQLSIAQQNGQRMFEMAKMQRENELYVGRNASELAERQRLEQLSRLQIKNEGAQATFAAVKERHPEWKPDPDKSVDENLASANKLNEDDQFEGFKPIADSAKQAQADHIALLTKAGAYQPPTQSEINQRVLNDPALASLLSKNSRGQQIADMLTKGASIADIEKVASNYWNSKDDRALILGAMQKASTDISTLKQQNALQVAGAQGQLSANRVNTTNELLNNMIAKASPQLQARMAQYVGQSPAPATAPALNPSGLRTDLLPPPSADTTQPPAPGETAVPPGTAPSDNPNLYMHQDLLKGALETYQQKQVELNDIDTRRNAGGQLQALPSGEAGYAVLNPRFVPFSNSEKADLAKQRLKALKDISKASDDIDTHTKALQQIDPNFGAPRPGTGMGNLHMSPADQIPATPNGALPPAPGAIAQPGSAAPAQPAIPGPNGVQLSPMHVQAGFNTASRLFGVDQPTLVAAHNYATSRLGMSEQQVSQLVTAAAEGDPVSTQKVKSIIAAATQSGATTNGQSAPFQSPALQQSPDATTLPPMPAY